MKLKQYFSQFKSYLEKYMPTSAYPRRIQDAIDRIYNIDIKLNFCESPLDYFDFKVDWVICKDKLEHADAKEVFNNRFYIMIKDILDKYPIMR